ncbi:hypothetical protein JJB11_01660 [Ramlibacter ginsenosidimutans]|uniref:Universal stress protein n=1 Tax=Ramlibacter ginsenosidimutans TaxID=502333 RepID=A0A934TNW1_9BURK|nr:hypothetical protein [Ramlibacter ginsenosidimutans]
MSDFSSILVHMDASPRCAERLALAIRLAQEHGAATLVALLALQPPATVTTASASCCSAAPRAAS